MNLCPPQAHSSADLNEKVAAKHLLRELTEAETLSFDEVLAMRAGTYVPKTEPKLKAPVPSVTAIEAEIGHSVSMRFYARYLGALSFFGGLAADLTWAETANKSESASLPDYYAANPTKMMEQLTDEQACGLISKKPKLQETFLKVGTYIDRAHEQAREQIYGDILMMAITGSAIALAQKAHDYVVKTAYEQKSKNVAKLDSKAATKAIQSVISVPAF